MPRLLADVNFEGHWERLLGVLTSGWRKELWTDLRIDTTTFRALGLGKETSDRELWNLCQVEKLILITANRNGEGADSLDATIRDSNDLHHLPVITLSKTGRLGFAPYRALAADRLLGYLMALENHLGAGRLYIP